LIQEIVARPNFREEIEGTLKGRVCLMGLGNPAYGDDGLGVRLVEELADDGMHDIIVAGTDAERWIDIAASRGFDHLVFVDAVDFGGEPGAVVFLNAADIEARFPQISTHKISLGVLAELVESNGVTKVWLLGVQPESTWDGPHLSPAVRATLDVLQEILLQLKTKGMPEC
jgi:hydrogenase 3 maturation protease